MPPKLFISDQRMLLLMQWAIQVGIAENETEYLATIKFPRTNISNLRRGHQSFTKEHILRACTLTGASADYIFGFTNLRTRKHSKAGIDRLKEAVMAVELDLKENNSGTRKRTQT